MEWSFSLPQAGIRPPSARYRRASPSRRYRARLRDSAGATREHRAEEPGWAAGTCVASREPRGARCVPAEGRAEQSAHRTARGACGGRSAHLAGGLRCIVYTARARRPCTAPPASAHRWLSQPHSRNVMRSRTRCETCVWSVRDDIAIFFDPISTLANSIRRRIFSNFFARPRHSTPTLTRHTRVSRGQQRLCQTRHHP